MTVAELIAKLQAIARMRGVGGDMRAIGLVLACVAMAGCSESHGEEPGPSAPASIAGAWSRKDGACEYAFLFGADGRYEALMICADGDERIDVGQYDADIDTVFARPDGACGIKHWEAQYIVRSDMLLIGGLTFTLLEDSGPFERALSCD